MSGEVNVLALVRGEEQYIFIFDPARRTDLLRLLGRYAADPELAFNWFDAAVLSHKIRELMPATIAASSNEATQAAPLSGSSKGVMHSPRFHIPRP